MDDISTSERFFRTLGECQQLFKEREEELITDVTFRERVIEDKNDKLRDVEDKLREKTREVNRLKEIISSTAVDDFVRQQKELGDAKAVELIAKEEEIRDLKKSMKQMKVLEDEQDIIVENLNFQLKDLKRRFDEQELDLTGQDFVISELRETIDNLTLLLDSKDGDLERESKKVAELELEAKRVAALERQLGHKAFDLEDAKRSLASMEGDLKLKDLEIKNKDEHIEELKKLLDEVVPDRDSAPLSVRPLLLRSQFTVSHYFQFMFVFHFLFLN